jgi:hypothetical protein
MTTNSFGARDRLEVGDAAHEIFRLDLNNAHDDRNVVALPERVELSPEREQDALRH